MQHLNVSRYTASPTWASSVTPVSGDWILFVPHAGTPLLFTAIGPAVSGENGATVEREYAPASATIAQQ
jgi:hypothetical protein